MIISVIRPAVPSLFSARLCVIHTNIPRLLGSTPMEGCAPARPWEVRHLAAPLGNDDDSSIGLAPKGVVLRRQNYTFQIDLNHTDTLH